MRNKLFLTFLRNILPDVKGIDVPIKLNIKLRNSGRHRICNVKVDRIFITNWRSWAQIPILFWEDYEETHGG